MVCVFIIIKIYLLLCNRVITIDEDVGMKHYDPLKADKQISTHREHISCRVK